MVGLSTADQRVSPPRIDIPRDYNAAHDLIERNLQAGRASKVAYIDDRGSTTYAELAERVNRCSNALIGLGLEPEQRVLLCVLDTIDFPTAFLGSIKAGIVPIAANTLLTTADYEYMLRDSRAHALIVSAPLLPAFAPLLGRMPHLRHVIVCGVADEKAAAGHHSFSNLVAEASVEFRPVATTSDDACFWLYSSGSTGAPKGTVHAHSSLITTAELYARPILGIREDDVVFSAAKLFFAYGLGNGLTFPLSVGATTVLMAERPTPAAVFARLAKHQPTIFYGVPTLFAALLASPDPPKRGELRLRICASAGEAWCGSAVTTITLESAPSSFSQRARARICPAPVSYAALISSSDLSFSLSPLISAHVNSSPFQSFSKNRSESSVKPWRLRNR